MVESMDIFPTVLVAAGIGVEHLEGRLHPIEGVPLQDLLNGEADRFRYALTRRGTFVPMPFRRYIGYKVRRRLAPLGVAESGTEPGDDYALIDGSTKYIARTVQQDLLFDLEADPCELDGSIWLDPARGEHMRSIVATMLGELRRLPSRRHGNPLTRRRWNDFGSWDTSSNHRGLEIRTERSTPQAPGSPRSRRDRSTRR